MLLSLALLLALPAAAAPAGGGRVPVALTGWTVGDPPGFRRIWDTNSYRWERGSGASAVRMYAWVADFPCYEHTVRTSAKDAKVGRFRAWRVACVPQKGYPKAEDDFAFGRPAERFFVDDKESGMAPWTPRPPEKKDNSLFLSVVGATPAALKAARPAFDAWIKTLRPPAAAAPQAPAAPNDADADGAVPLMR